jgi:tetratricopeptide (TPR) repeat protein
MDEIRLNDTDRHEQTRRYEALRQLGDSYASVGDYSQAQSCYQQAASVDPDEPGPYVGLGAAALQTDELEDAEIAFRVACRLDPRCAKAYAGLAMVCQRRREFPRAFDLYMKSLEFDGDNIPALLGLFQVSCEMRSFAKVTHYLEVYLAMHPGDVSVMFALAALYLKDNRAEQSRTILRNLLALEPAHRDAANLLEEVEHALSEVR